MCPRSGYTGLVYKVPDPVDRYSPFLIPTCLWLIEAYLFGVRSSLRSDAIAITTDGRTDRHSSNVLEFRADQISPRNLGSQINISMRPTRIDKTNMRRV